MRRLACLLAVLVLGIMALGIVWTGCNNPDTRSVGPVEPVDYPVCFWDGSVDNWFYIYYPAANQVDSFYMECAVKDYITVSADGGTLYVNRNSSIAVVDIDSGTIVEELPYVGRVDPSADRQWLAITGHRLDILRSSDYSVAFTDSTDGAFSADGKQYYVYVPGTIEKPAHVRVLDITNGFAVVSTIDLAGVSVKKLIPSPDDTRLYLYCYTGKCTRSFGVFDIAADSLIHWYPFAPGKGDMAMTPDGRYVFFSGPGDWLIIGDDCPWPPLVIYMYDTQTNQTTQIRVSEIPGGSYGDGLWIDGLEVTPDGRYLVANEMGGKGIILALNIATLEISHYVALGGDYARQILSLSCQKSH